MRGHMFPDEIVEFVCQYCHTGVAPYHGTLSDHINGLHARGIAAAAAVGNEIAVRTCLESNDDNLADERNSSGKPALVLAAEIGHEGIVRMLLERVKDVNASGGTPTVNPLWCSILKGKGRLSITKLLIDSGADLQSTYAGSWGTFTPLQWVLFSEPHPEIRQNQEEPVALIKLLLEAGVNRSIGGLNNVRVWQSLHHPPPLRERRLKFLLDNSEGNYGVLKFAWAVAREYKYASLDVYLEDSVYTMSNRNDVGYSDDDFPGFPRCFDPQALDLLHFHLQS